MKFVVMYKLPSGWWTTYQTDSRDEADNVAGTEMIRTGWDHVVVVVTP